MGHEPCRVMRLVRRNFEGVRHVLAKPGYAAPICAATAHESWTNEKTAPRISGRPRAAGLTMGAASPRNLKRYYSATSPRVILKKIRPSDRWQYNALHATSSEGSTRLRAISCSRGERE